MYSRKQVPGALPSRGIIKGAEGTPGPTKLRTSTHQEETDLGADDAEPLSRRLSFVHRGSAVGRWGTKLKVGGSSPPGVANDFN